MEIEYEDLNKDQAPRSLVDSIAGSGPPRPILKELYSLVSLDEVFISRARGVELFGITAAGHYHAEVIRIIIQGLNLPKGIVFIPQE